MCSTSKYERAVIDLLQDPLIRLVMDSDGVTEQALIAILEHLRIALAARSSTAGARQVGVAGDRRAHEYFPQRSVGFAIGMSFRLPGRPIRPRGQTVRCSGRKAVNTLLGIGNFDSRGGRGAWKNPVDRVSMPRHQVSAVRGRLGGSCDRTGWRALGHGCRRCRRANLGCWLCGSRRSPSRPRRCLCAGVGRSPCRPYPAMRAMPGNCRRAG